MPEDQPLPSIRPATIIAARRAEGPRAGKGAALRGKRSGRLRDVQGGFIARYAPPYRPGARDGGGVHSQEWLCYQRRFVLLRARWLCWGAAGDGAAHGLRVRTAVSCIAASVNGAACTA